MDVYPAFSLVESLKGPIIGALSDATPALLCHKEPARRKNTPIGGYFLLLAGSLWHKDSWLPCTGRSYYRRQLECWISLVPGISARHADQAGRHRPGRLPPDVRHEPEHQAERPGHVRGRDGCWWPGYDLGNVQHWLPGAGAH